MSYQPKDRAEVEARYGKIEKNDAGKLLWRDERLWMQIIEIPRVAHYIVNTASGNPWRSVYINKDMAKPLVDTIELLHIKGLLREVRAFDGAFNIRLVRGNSTLHSIHSWGLAFDWNAATNKLGCQPTWSKAFLDTMRQMGWCIGAEFSRRDPMHFSWVGDE